MVDINQKLRHWLFRVVLAVAVFQGALPAAPARSNDASSYESPGNLVIDALKRGEELRHQWNLDAAETAFHEAAALEPSNLEAVLGLARIARARLEFDRALGFLDKATNEHPNAPNVLTEYGSLYLAAEEPQRARRYFENALQIPGS